MSGRTDSGSCTGKVIAKYSVSCVGLSAYWPHANRTRVRFDAKSTQNDLDVYILLNKGLTENDDKIARH